MGLGAEKPQLQVAQPAAEQHRQCMMYLLPTTLAAKGAARAGDACPMLTSALCCVICITRVMSDHALNPLIHAGLITAMQCFDAGKRLFLQVAVCGTGQHYDWQLMVPKQCSYKAGGALEQTASLT